MSDFPDYQVGSRRLATPSESIEEIHVEQIDTVASGESESVYVYPPSGYLYELLGLELDVEAVAAATSGTHHFFLYSEKEMIDFLGGTSSYDVKIHFANGVWIDADLDQDPPTATAQALMVEGLRASEHNGYHFLYWNETDADQTNKRDYVLSVRKIRVL